MRGAVLTCTLMAAAALATGCASTGAVPRPFPMAGTPPRSARPPAPELPVDPTALTETALALRGTPYRDGGTDPAGFDCSGFTQYVFAHSGIALPRDVKSQFNAGRSIAMDEIVPGDLLFFATVAPGASHVGIALDRTTFVHAPSSSGVVRVEQIGSTYWSSRFVGARRIG